MQFNAAVTNNANTGLISGREAICVSTPV